MDRLAHTRWSIRRVLRVFDVLAGIRKDVVVVIVTLYQLDFPLLSGVLVFGVPSHLRTSSAYMT